MKTLTTACGCEIHVIKWSSKANSVTMQSCPLHKAAKDLLEAAEARAGALSTTLRKLMPVLICSHKHTRGGNDYLSCDDCGFEWNYAKSDPLYAVIDHNPYIAALLD